MTGKNHSRLSASSSHRWLNCPGSVNLSDGLEPEPSHISAQEGTVAHAIAEQVIMDRLGGASFDHRSMLNSISSGITITAEMLNAAEIMADVVESLCSDGDSVYIEETVSLAYIHKEMFGTSDVFIKYKDGSIAVIDFKYGTWPVSPVENPQLIYYFLGARAEMPCQKGTLKIVQPRSRDGNVIKSWDIDKPTYLKWEDTFKEKSRLADLGLPLVKGEWCRFCPAKKVCRLQK